MTVVGATRATKQKGSIMAIITLLITELAKFTVTDEIGAFETVTVQHVRSDNASRETFRTVRWNRDFEFLADGSESIVDHFSAVDAMNFGLRFAGWPELETFGEYSEAELDSDIDEYHETLVNY